MRGLPAPRCERGSHSRGALMASHLGRAAKTCSDKDRFAFATETPVRKASLARPRSRELFMPDGMSPSFVIPAGRSASGALGCCRRRPSGLPAIGAGFDEQTDKEQSIKSDDAE